MRILTRGVDDAKLLAIILYVLLPYFTYLYKSTYIPTAKNDNQNNKTTQRMDMNNNMRDSSAPSEGSWQIIYTLLVDIQLPSSVVWSFCCSSKGKQEGTTQKILQTNT